MRRSAGQALVHEGLVLGSGQTLAYVEGKKTDVDNSSSELLSQGARLLCRFARSRRACGALYPQA